MADPVALLVDNSDPTRRSAAGRRLRAHILGGGLQPGARLVERELCKITGASRSVVREVLIDLEGRGLIERESYKGFRIARLSPRRAAEIFEMRAVLEGHAAEAFTERASEAEIAGLRNAFSDLAAAVSASDTPAMHAAKARYYDLLFTGCRNRELRIALSAVMDRIMLIRGSNMADSARRRASLAEMRRLTEALAARDPIAARAATLAHIDGARRAALEALSADAERSTA